MMTIEGNVTEVLESVAEVSKQVGRSVNDVSVIAVTKYVDSEMASQLVKAGVRHIGENRVDKFLEKYDAMKDKNITWHLIGTLQRRKVKDVINLIDYFHALDSVKLAQEIQKRANHPVNCFIQVNISGELSKHGFSVEELEKVLPELEGLDKVNVVGLMTMAPFDASSEEIELIFAKTKGLQEKLQKKQIKNMPLTELSMGMSGDYDQAIANGATYVRIGSAFFKGE